MLTTTLNEIRDASPCKSGWEKLLKHIGKTGPDDAMLPVATILEANGIDDALWVLASTCDEKGRAICAAFAADCAERALPIWEAHYPKDKRPRSAIEAARSGGAAFANAAIFTEAAFDAAANAARATYAAAYASTATAADAAACSAADRDAERAWQAAHLRKLIERAV